MDEKLFKEVKRYSRYDMPSIGTECILSPLDDRTEFVKPHIKRGARCKVVPCPRSLYREHNVVYVNFAKAPADVLDMVSPEFLQGRPQISEWAQEILTNLANRKEVATSENK
ncbi:MAG: hypothetical protein CMB80_02295 [Flammeovirgaceae bacterium]|nr:hypothetical protein [Flammeovirgaceae bacterium]